VVAPARTSSFIVGNVQSLPLKVVPNVVHKGVTLRKALPARFFEADSGAVPVRDWLLALDAADRKVIGDDIRTAEFGWPIGMPLCRSIRGRKGLWEIRSALSQGRIARVFFCAHDGSMVLLHGFIKKSRQTPDKELAIAERRMRGLT
jgi:phage-related protein